MRWRDENDSAATATLPERKDAQTPASTRSSTAGKRSIPGPPGGGWPPQHPLRRDRSDGTLEAEQAHGWAAAATSSCQSQEQRGARVERNGAASAQRRRGAEAGLTQHRAKSPQSHVGTAALLQMLRGPGPRPPSPKHVCVMLGVLACVSAGGGTQGWKPAPGGAARCRSDICSCTAGTSSVA